VSLFKKMADKHEKELVDFLGGHLSRGSGNQWKSQMDGRHNRMRRRFAFAWDGKSTLRQGLSVTLKMWNKAKDQAAGERPMLAFRFYATETLEVTEDLVIISLNDFAELMDAAESSRVPEPTRIFYYDGLSSLTVPEKYAAFQKPLRPDRRYIVMVHQGAVTFPDAIEFSVDNPYLRSDFDFRISGEEGWQITRSDSVPRPRVTVDGEVIKGPVEIYWNESRYYIQGSM
jgi:hypothetical protein